MLSPASPASNFRNISTPVTTPVGEADDLSSRPPYACPLDAAGDDRAAAGSKDVLISIRNGFDLRRHRDVAVEASSARDAGDAFGIALGASADGRTTECRCPESIRRRQLAHLERPDRTLGISWRRFEATTMCGTLTCGDGVSRLRLGPSTALTRGWRRPSPAPVIMFLM